MNECEKAMESGRPSSKADSWDFTGALRDLELDVDSMIRSIDLDELSEGEAGKENGKASKWRRFPAIPLRNYLGEKTKKRMKWVVMQSIVLALNFAQNEVSRRSAVYLIDKRHAEVPPFPLL